MSVRLSVCPSVGRLNGFRVIFLRTFFKELFSFRVLISVRVDIVPIDFVFTRSEVKVTRVKFVKRKYRYTKNVGIPNIFR